MNMTSPSSTVAMSEVSSDHTPLVERLYLMRYLRLLFIAAAVIPTLFPTDLVTFATLAKALAVYVVAIALGEFTMFTLKRRGVATIAAFCIFVDAAFVAYLCL